MNKNVLKNVTIVCIICITGFVIGYLAKDLLIEKVDADSSVDNVVHSSFEEKYDEYAEIFPDDLYTFAYDSKLNTYDYQKKENIARTRYADLYTKSDALDLAEHILDCKYELRKVEETDNRVVYEEYQNGYPTGACAYYVLDVDGTISYVFYRKGVIYDLDETAKISIKEAFELGIEAIYNKYGEDTIIDGDIYDYEYKVFYKPDVEKVCYSIEGVVGHMHGDMETDINQVRFMIDVSIDGSFVEVGSTLGY